MTHYDTLQVSRTASIEVIEAAYKSLMKLYHPDVSGDTRYAQALNAAHDVLTDLEKREKYDRSLRPRPAQPHCSLSPAQCCNTSGGAGTGGEAAM